MNNFRYECKNIIYSIHNNSIHNKIEIENI